MLASSCFGAALAVIFTTLPMAVAQLNLPSCISKCIDQSTDDSCQITDVKCICRESNGAFLPNMVLCIHGACDNSINVSDLLTPLSLACDLAGTPISSWALQNAESAASSIATVTTTMTDSVTPSASVSVSVSLTTMTYTTTANGKTKTSTLTDFVSASYGYVPVVIATTDWSDGSSYTFTTMAPGTLLTVMTTNSAGSTTTATVVSSSSASDSSSVDSTGSAHTTTTVLSQETTGSSGSEAESTAASSTQTGEKGQQTNMNSAPFTNTNGAARERGGSWLGLGIVAVGVVFFW